MNSLKYLSSTTFGYKDITIKETNCVAETHNSIIKIMIFKFENTFFKFCFRARYEDRLEQLREARREYNSRYDHYYQVDPKNYF